MSFQVNAYRRLLSEGPPIGWEVKKLFYCLKNAERTYADDRIAMSSSYLTIFKIAYLFYLLSAPSGSDIRSLQQLR